MSHYQDQVHAIWAAWLQRDYTELKDAVRLAVTQDLSNMLVPPPGEKFYGYSLYTCNGLLHIYAVLNTMPERQDHIEREQDQYTHNCADEWRHCRQDGYFDPVNECLTALREEFESLNDAFEDLEWDGVTTLDDDVDNYWERHVERMFAAVLEALVELQKAGHFSDLEQAASPLLMIWFSDASVWEMEMIKESVRRLNSEFVYEEFCAVFNHYGNH